MSFQQRPGNGCGMANAVVVSPKIIRRGTRLVVHFRDFTNLMRTVYMKFWYLNVFDGDIMINRMMLVVSLLCSTIIRMMMTMTDMFEVAWNHQSASKILRFGVLIFRGWAKQDQRWSEAMAASTHHNCRWTPYWCQCWLPVYIAHCQLPKPRLEKPAAVDRLKWQPCFPHNFGEISSHKRRHVSSTYANLRWLLLRHGEGCIIPRWTRFDMKQRMNVMSCPRGLAVDNAWKCTGWFLVSLTCGSCSLSDGPRNLSGKKWTISDHQSFHRELGHQPPDSDLNLTVKHCTQKYYNVYIYIYIYIILVYKYICIYIYIYTYTNISS